MTECKKPSKAAARKRALVKAVAAKRAADKAVVLGRVTARSGKVYQVLAPAAEPRHLSSLEIERAIEQMLAAR